MQGYNIQELWPLHLYVVPVAILFSKWSNSRIPTLESASWQYYLYELC